MLYLVVSFTTWKTVFLAPLVTRHFVLRLQPGPVLSDMTGCTAVNKNILDSDIKYLDEC